MNDTAPVAVIVNPVAGSGAGARIFTQIRPLLSAAYAGRELTFIETTGKEHAEELGASIDAGLILAISGDGTVHDIAQGIMRRPRDERPVIAPIPVGSGNDISKTYGISRDPLQAVRDLQRAVPCCIDVGRVNSTFFLETLSFGVDAAVGLNTAELRKTTKARGALLYAHAAVLAILTDLKARKVHFTLDGVEHSEELLILAVQNGPTYGGGFKVAPAAKPDDGILNICYATKISPPVALYYLARMKNGNHEHLRSITTATARNLSIDFETHPATQCDGEPLDGTHFDITLLPAAMRIMVPQ
jgi:YegS/Rv2252/BmrU family lipid kinase